MLALYIIAGIIFLVILTLSVPVELVFDVKTPVRGKSRIRVGWLFGLLWKEIRPSRKKPEGKRKRGVQFLISLLSKGLLGKISKLVRQILSRIRIRQLDADLRVGLDDPVDTGILYAIMWPAIVSLNSSGPVQVRMEPSFVESALEVSMRGRIRLFPIQMVGPLLCFVFSLASLRAARSVVVSRWKKKKSESDSISQSGT